MEGKKKTLEQMLFEFAGKPTAGNSAKNYKVFMEHWDEIRAEHDKGWSYLIIWKTMKAAGVLSFSYPTFTNYIRKYEGRQEKAAVKKPLQCHQSRIGRAEVGQGHQSPGKTDSPVFGDNVRRRDDKYF